MKACALHPFPVLLVESGSGPCRRCGLGPGNPQRSGYPEFTQFQLLWSWKKGWLWWLML